MGAEGAAAALEGEELGELGDRDRCARLVVEALADRGAQGRRLERLAQEAEAGHRRRRGAGGHDHGDRQAAVGDVAQQLDAVDHRHGQAGDQQVDVGPLEHLERLGPVGDAGEAEVLAAQAVFDELAGRRLVVDEHDVPALAVGVHGRGSGRGRRRQRRRRHGLTG